MLLNTVLGFMHITKAKQHQLAFTLVEGVVIVLVIGLLSTGAALLFNNYRIKARDVRRINDAGIFYAALEDFRRQEGRYPMNSGAVNEFIPGQSLVGPTSQVVFLEKIPQNPKPRTDGDCLDEDYRYVGTTGALYYIEFCLGQGTKSIQAGKNHVLPSAPICPVLCFGKECGSDGCGGVCGPGCPEGETCNASGICE